jgi:hypothetical protein
MIPQSPVVSIFALTGLSLLTHIIHLPYHASENLTPNSPNIFNLPTNSGKDP